MYCSQTRTVSSSTNMELGLVWQQCMAESGLGFRTLGVFLLHLNIQIQFISDLLEMGCDESYRIN